MYEHIRGHIGVDLHFHDGRESIGESQLRLPLLERHDAAFTANRTAECHVGIRKALLSRLKQQ